MSRDGALGEMASAPSISRDDWERVKRVAAEALARPADERAAYAVSACSGDEALCREVLSLLDSIEQAGDRFETPALALPSGSRAVVDAIGPSPSAFEGGQIGHWKILRQLGHGGMGTVYLAERVNPEFRQRAAVKIARGGPADDMLLRRFQDERRILAALDHPHIAHLIDGGTTDLGVPYVVMEYVDGRPIDRFCHERALDVRERLEVFRLVCLAVHYAHQRLVVHRDLKASNILVTAEGMPKLLDFGIAKILGGDGTGDATRTLFRVLTPESASPEQLRGETITTATDIYGLGMLLYGLLTGSSPYRVSTTSETELVRAICEEPPEPPSAAPRGDSGIGAKHAIDRDLDRIVLMALRKEPDRRYGTAEQLAGDVRLYLEGRPIIAAPDDVLYRTRKFVARNRVAVAAGLGFLIAVAGGIVTTTWQARTAMAERNRAQHHFTAVKSLAGSVLGELHDTVARLPGSLAARELLIRRATEYLDSLAADTGDDARLRQELALGYKRLAQVQGHVGLPNLGDRASARRNFEQAAALFESIDSRSIDVNGAVGLIETYAALAQSDPDTGTRTAHLAKARSNVERVLREAPSDQRVLGAAIVVWCGIGNEQERAEDYAAALQSFASQARAAESRVALMPDSGDASRDLSLAYKKMATQHELLGEVEDALALYVKAMALDRTRVDREPGRGIWRLDLSFSHDVIGTVLLKQGQNAEAIEHHRQAVELRRAVVAANPDDDFAQTSLARGYDRLASTLSQLGDVDGAIRADLDRIAVLDHRRSAHPDRDEVWLEQTTAMMDAARRCLTMLERDRGPAVSTRAKRVRTLLERVSVLQAQWGREKRTGPLPPDKADLDESLERCDR